MITLQQKINKSSDNGQSSQDYENMQKLIKAFSKKLPDLTNSASFGLKKMKDVENTGNLLFDKYKY